jgi:hypothetical protein
MPKATLRTLIFIWLGWFVVLYGFQWVVASRLLVMRPDYAVSWSGAETTAVANRGKIYLLDPFMNRQVAWDSEYYLGIAVGGYDDPKAGTAVVDPATGERFIKNYSFFPFYPYVTRAVALPLGWAGMEPIPAATAAGLAVTLLGTLAGMIALWHLARESLDEEGALRAAFYLLIFPTAFFLAMVYTEGLFFGLACWSLLLSKRKHWLWASLLAVLATWTRAHGASLFLPLLWAWWMEGKTAVRGRFWWAQGAAALLPLAAYLLWRFSELGQGWAKLQPYYFGRGFFSISKTIGEIFRVYEYAQTNSQATVYYSLELATVLLALAAAIWLLRRDPPVALFGLAVIALSVFSGSAQSLARYMIISPPLYIFLAHLGRSKAFDRVWSFASALLLGMLATLFAFDMWVG